MSSSRYDDFISLRGAVVRAVGLSWGDDKFKHDFLENPFGAMREAFGYDCPFDVAFEATESGAESPHYYDALHTGGWVGTNNTVELCLPPRPAAANQRPEALAAYNRDFTFFLREKTTEEGSK